MNNLIKADVQRYLKTPEILLDTPRNGPEVFSTESEKSISNDVVDVVDENPRFVSLSLNLSDSFLKDGRNLSNHLVSSISNALINTPQFFNDSTKIKLDRYSSTSKSNVIIDLSAKTIKSKTITPSFIERKFNIDASLNTDTPKDSPYLLIRDTISTKIGPGFIDPILMKSQLAILQLVKVRSEVNTIKQNDNVESNDLYDFLTGKSVPSSKSNSTHNITTTNSQKSNDDIFDILSSNNNKKYNIFNNLILDLEFTVNSKLYNSGVVNKFLNNLKLTLQN